LIKILVAAFGDKEVIAALRKHPPKYRLTFGGRPDSRSLYYSSKEGQRWKKCGCLREAHELNAPCKGRHRVMLAKKRKRIKAKRASQAQYAKSRLTKVVVP
jgi:hypothetical protein